MSKPQQEQIEKQLDYSSLQTPPPQQANAATNIGFAKLLPFISANNAQTPERAIPVLRKDYLELVDWTGRAIRADKKGAIAENAPPILQRLGLNEKNWVKNAGIRVKPCLLPL